MGTNVRGVVIALVLLCGTAAASDCTGVVVALADGTDAAGFAAESGLRYVGPLGQAGSALGNLHEFSGPCDEKEVRRATRDARVLDVLVQTPRLRTGRELDSSARMRSSYTPAQWHLSDATDATGHVLGAWARGFDGRGVTVIVVDDGLDRTHPDLAPGYAAGVSGNYNGGDGGDPMPPGDDAHGTAAASIAAAAGQRSVPDAARCGHGVAPGAHVAGVRLIARPVTDAEEARALSIWKTVPETGVRAVYSCSWGPTDDGRRLDGPGQLTALAVAAGAASGQVVYVWASGNGAEQGDTCTYDGYAQHPDVLAIGAIAHDGRAPAYSEGCPGLFGVAPSSGNGRRIGAADIAGRRGVSRDDCRTDFGGTSAAAPFFAGVAAVVASANPLLRSRDVARVLALSAKHVDSGDSGWQRNAAGIWHSDRYGFGAVDAETAVVTALDYAALPVECDVEIEVGAPASSSFPRAIPDAGAPVSSCVSVTGSGVPSGVTVERATAVVTIEHPRRSDLELELVAPSGTVARFRRRPLDTGPGAGRDAFTAWRFESLKTWGEPAEGTWCLVVKDAVLGNRGSLVAWSLEIVGVRRDCGE